MNKIFIHLLLYYWKNFLPLYTFNYLVKKYGVDLLTKHHIVYNSSSLYSIKPHFSMRFDYFPLNTKYTAATSRKNARIWFHLNCSVLKTASVNTVKTLSEITSWITFSCMSDNGPPFPIYPMRLAGTWKQYSASAIPQLIRIMAINGSDWNHFMDTNFKCPYHAKVIKTFDSMSSKTV